MVGSGLFYIYWLYFERTPECLCDGLHVREGDLQGVPGHSGEVKRGKVQGVQGLVRGSAV